MPAYCGLGLDYSLVGKVVGRWTRIGPSFVTCSDGRHRKRVVVCQCGCGAIHVVSDSGCKQGHSGGCKACASRRNNSTHGRTSTTEYKIYRGIISRCYKTSHASFKRYGAKGIRVCDEWRGKGGFEAFLEYVGMRPSARHWIDRIDSRGNYEPGNVRWATTVEQARNRSNNTVIEYDGRSMCVSAWAEEFGLRPRVLYHRLKAGWEIDKALHTPLRRTLNRT